MGVVLRTPLERWHWCVALVCGTVWVSTAPALDRSPMAQIAQLALSALDYVCPSNPWLQGVIPCMVMTVGNTVHLVVIPTAESMQELCSGTSSRAGWGRERQG